MHAITANEAILTYAVTGQEATDVLSSLGVTPEYLDDHYPTPTMVKPQYVLAMNNGMVTEICPTAQPINGIWAFSLNPLYLKNGQVHLSKWSISTFLIKENCGIEEAVDLFNSESDANPFSEWRISAVISL